MAPFKLKFRMGSSRSTSQEVDVDPQANQALLNNSNVGIGASNSTIDSADCTSLVSIGNDKRSLLPNNSNGEPIGYLNPVAATHSVNNNNIAPESPPPSYEEYLEENRLTNFNSDTLDTSGGGGGGESPDCDMSHVQNSSVNTSIENLSNTCTDPDCTMSVQQEGSGRRKSIDTPQRQAPSKGAGAPSPTCPENILECTGSCDPLLVSPSEEDPPCGGKLHHQFDLGEQPQEAQTSHLYEDSQDCQSSGENGNCSDEDWDSHHGQTHIYQPEVTTTSEIISNKSSKEIYKAVAKQWGITCKMSEQCRCMECQSHYFDCEFDENEHQKTDGGLGAGTPMFISEVMHGSACTIL